MRSIRSLASTLTAVLVLSHVGFAQDEGEGCIGQECPGSPPPTGGLQWEHIHDTYRNVRGYAYFPVYASLSKYVGTQHQGRDAPGDQGLYNGASSSTATWYFYDKDPVPLTPADGLTVYNQDVWFSNLAALGVLDDAIKSVFQAGGSLNHPAAIGALSGIGDIVEEYLRPGLPNPIGLYPSNQ